MAHRECIVAVVVLGVLVVAVPVVFLQVVLVQRQKLILGVDFILKQATNVLGVIIVDLNIVMIAPAPNLILDHHHQMLV